MADYIERTAVIEVFENADFDIRGEEYGFSLPTVRAILESIPVVPKLPINDILDEISKERAMSLCRDDYEIGFDEGLKTAYRIVEGYLTWL